MCDLSNGTIAVCILYAIPFHTDTGIMSMMRYNARYGTTIGGRPVASVRPMMSSPLAIRSSSAAAAAGQSRLLIPAGRASSGLKPGVSLQQIQTTTGILLLKLRSIFV